MHDGSLHYSRAKCTPFGMKGLRELVSLPNQAPCRAVPTQLCNNLDLPDPLEEACVGKCYWVGLVGPATGVLDSFVSRTPALKSTAAPALSAYSAACNHSTNLRVERPPYVSHSCATLPATSTKG